ncbi:MAG: NADH:ubiquinone reductase (Na(+)-transporting) subunit C [Muribaculaceae bacterium]|jgi:Na+-transporting NADH:ubiquinone oxidoreductase subunit C|nr:NADH:ubiquinone reductase (Na(+)-transporting) subunit C [Muribaculaceae bacterium]
MNKNSNTYQILYAAVMVLIVGTVLAFIYMALKPKQNENIANDTRKQIMSALHIATPSDDQVKETYEKYIIQDLLVDMEGNIVDSAQNVAFDVDMKKNVKLAERQLPVMKCRLDDGSIKYVLPVYGAGLWGPIWGYIAMNDDGNTIYGANFSHEGETPGLGARIADQDFQDKFVDKHLFKEGEYKGVVVLKRGQKSTTGAEQIDALTGATITSRGVSDMLADCLAPYEAFLKRLQGNNEAPAAVNNVNQPE